MADENKTIIGWAVDRAGGAQAADLAADLNALSKEIMIFDGGGYWQSGGAEASIVATVDVFGLDPRLDFVMQFSRVDHPGPPPTGVLLPQLKTGMVATIVAQTLAEVRGNVVAGATLPSTLFVNGGAIDALGSDDGCELTSGVQGVRFTLTGIRNAQTYHDLVLQILIKPNVSLGCVALAEKLISKVRVNATPIRRFGG